MKTYKKALIVSLLSIIAVFYASGVLAKVVTYRAPAGEKVSREYKVAVDGKPLDLYVARTLDPPFAGQQFYYGGPYCFANFDMSGKATVRIKSGKSMRNVNILPKSARIKHVVEDDHTIVFTLDHPVKISIEADGKNYPLLLFANRLEQRIPKPSDANVIFLGPGIHRTGTIRLGSGQTLYIAGGAVVKGRVLVSGSNIRICGRGMLDGSDVAWKAGPALIDIRNVHNLEINDITLRGSPNWTIVPRNSEYVTVRNVKICNSRVQNDDGIDICNSRDVLVTDCFIRTDDDCIALKGMDYQTGNNNIERITVENCILWCDRARTFLLGHESQAEYMRHITIRDIDIIHFAMAAFLIEPGEDMQLTNVNVSNICINGDGQRDLIIVRPTVNAYMRKKVPGHVRNVNFQKIRVDGRQGKYLVTITGIDSSHAVENITFTGISVLNNLQTQDSTRVEIGEHVYNVKFN